jgi:hypothetical protein
MEFPTLKSKVLSYVGTLKQIRDRFVFTAPVKKDDHSSIHIAFSFHQVLDGYSPSVSYSPDFECGSALINLAAAASRAAVDAKAGNLVEACKLFREAAGIFAFLQEQAEYTRLGGLSRDFSVACLGFFGQLCQAQAQMCLFNKAVQTFTAAEPGSKPAVGAATIAQFAAGACELFAGAAAAAEADPHAAKYLRGAKPASFNWVSYAHYQRLTTLAAANMWHARLQLDGHLYGKEILYLAFALQFAGHGAKLDDKIASVVPAAVAALKDNNAVYFDHVPSEGPAVPAKIMATPVPFSVPAAADPYGSLMLPAVAAKVRAAQEQVDKSLGQARTSLSMLSDAARARLAALGLPARVATQEGLPEEVWQQVQEAGGAAGVDAMEHGAADVQAQSQRAAEEWQRALAAVDEEEHRDADLKQRYPQAAQSVDSRDLNQSLRTELARAKQILDEAGKADASMRREMSMAKADTALLRLSKEELAAQVPSGEAGGARGAERDTVREKLAELSALLHARDAKVASAEAAVSEWSKGAMQTMSGKGEDAEVPREAATAAVEGLGVKDEEARQKALMGEVETAMAALELTEGGAGGSEREQWLGRVSRAAATVQRVRAHTKEGARFYGDMRREVLAPLAGRCEDFATARDLERRLVVENLARGFAGLAPNDPQQQQQGLGLASPPVPTRPSMQQQHSQPPQQQQQQGQQMPPQQQQGYGQGNGASAPDDGSFNYGYGYHRID